MREFESLEAAAKSIEEDEAGGVDLQAESVYRHAINCIHVSFLTARSESILKLWM